MSNYNLHLSTHPVFAIILNDNEVKDNSSLLLLPLTPHTGLQPPQPSSPAAPARPGRARLQAARQAPRAGGGSSAPFPQRLEAGNEQIGPPTTADAHAYQTFTASDGPD